MSNLASMPTRTSVAVRSDANGSDATIAAATEQQAGVMTAEMVKLLYQLRDLMATHSTPIPLRVEPLPAFAPQIVAPPAPQNTNLEPRIARLEAQAQASPVQAIADFRENVAHRISQIEARLLSLEQMVSANAHQQPQQLIPHDDVNELRRNVSEIAAQLIALSETVAENHELTALVSAMIHDPTPITEVANGTR